MRKIFLILAMLCSMAQAETYRVYIPFAAGSSPDILVRKVLDVAQMKSTDIFVAFNKPGAEGMIAYRAFLEDASPKILATTTALLLNGDLNVQDQTKSMIFYFKLGFLLVALKDSNLNTISDVKGKLNVGSAGSNQDILLKSLVKDPDVQIIRYPSDTDIVNGILKKELDLANISDGSLLFKANKDKFKIISNYDITNINFGVGFSVHKSMSHSELMKLNGIFNEVFQDEGFRKWLFDRLEKTPVGGKPEVQDKIVNDIRIYFEKHKLQ